MKYDSLINVICFGSCLHKVACCSQNAHAEDQSANHAKYYDTDSVELAWCDGHEGSFKNGGPPHSMLLPASDTIVALPKILVFGTGPDRLLKERFRYVRSSKIWRKSGMAPAKLLLERSRFSSPLKEEKPLGICPSKRFSCKYREFSWTQLLTASGISPESLFIDRSIVLRLFKFPICVGMEPLRALLERLRSKVREGILSISCGISPIKELAERSRDTSFVRVPRVGGMLPPRKLLDRERLLNCVILPNDCGIRP